MSAIETRQKEDAVSQNYGTHAQDWESSGQRQAAYCESNGLNYRKFVKHRKQLLSARFETRKRRGKVVPRFVPVRSPALAQADRAITSNNQSNTIIIRLPQGSVVELPDSLQSAQLSIIFKSLGAVLC